MTHTLNDWPADVFICVPAYRARASLAALLPVLLTIAPRANVCVADDGSHDGTDILCDELHVLYLSHSVNRGKGAMLSWAFQWLLDEKKAAWIVTMDADGQHSPSDLRKFTEKIRLYPDSDIILGKREIQPGKMPAARIVSNTLTSLFLSILAKRKIPDSQCGFRAYSARVLSSVGCRFSRFEMESEILLRAAARGFSIDSVAVQTVYFSTRASHISHMTDTLRWLRAVIATWLELRRAG
jgi:glycosyltransferase involved in cell wall biosynthesis